MLTLSPLAHITRRLILSPMAFRSEVLRQPKMRLRSMQQVVPPPGLDLKVPKWSPEDFLLKIGKGTSEYADKFESLDQVFASSSKEMKKLGVPPKERRHILRCIEKLRRGLLSFEYLHRRTSTTLPKPK